MYKILVLLFLSFASLGQQNYQVKFFDAPINLDGKLDDLQWQSVKKMGDFQQYFPSDSVKAELNSLIYIAYDNKNIYLGAYMESKGNDYIVPTLQRDFRAGSSDNITFIFDTFRDNTNAFLFGTNPLGVQREALLSNGATSIASFNSSWDNKWQSETFIGEGYWSCELVIPLATLRFKPNSQEWLFKSYRFDTQNNENSVLVNVPQNQIIMSLAYSIPMEFERPLPDPGTNISIIPYISAGASKDFENNGDRKSAIGIGGDAKIAITSGLNLDLTVNPDFSTVEVDQQVVNLTRFDITFPEQRQFFTENSDLFAGFGSVNDNPYVPPSGGSRGTQIVSPFFSRRVGIAFDSTSGTNVQNPIIYGLKLSGKLNDDWRIGLMNTMTGSDKERGISSTNYTVAALQRRVFKRSNIAAVFVNNQLMNPSSEFVGDLYDRVGGVEYNHQSLGNKWAGKVFYHQSFTADKKEQAFAHGLSLNYTVRSFTAKWSHDYVGAGFQSASGFIPRTDFFHINPTFGFNFYPEKGLLNRFSFGAAWDEYSRPNFGRTDLEAGPFISMAFRNSAAALISFNRNYTYLFEDFDALRSNDELPNLALNTDYVYHNVRVTLVSDRRKAFFVSLSPLMGQYYNGNIFSLSGSANYRFQPYVQLTLNAGYNDIKLAQSENKVFVIGPKAEVTFSKSLFWTSNLQYNSQFDNFNVNSRIQWRFAPVSDFFLVYSDNYNTNLGGVKNRAILAKLTYWLNM
ncbi:MAG: hypothetical protein ACI9IP_002793 [Arcticibacterium sp.]|jgi:hypothetical protein